MQYFTTLSTTELQNRNEGVLKVAAARKLITDKIINDYKKGLRNQKKRR